MYRLSLAAVPPVALVVAACASAPPGASPIRTTEHATPYREAYSLVFRAAKRCHDVEHISMREVAGRIGMGMLLLPFAPHGTINMAIAHTEVVASADPAADSAEIVIRSPSAFSTRKHDSSIRLTDRKPGTTLTTSAAYLGREYGRSWERFHDEVRSWLTDSPHCSVAGRTPR